MATLSNQKPGIYFLFRNNSEIIRKHRQAGWPLNLPRASSKSGSQIPGGSIVAEGDSLTYGTGATPGVTDYVTQMVELLGAGYTLTLNDGEASTNIAHMAAEATANIDSQYNATAYPNNILCWWGGSNDLITADSAETIWAAWLDYVQDRQAIGWLVIALTFLPRFELVGSGETKRQDLNTYLRNNAELYGYYVADVAGDSRIGDAGDCYDTTYYVDGDNIHMTATGYGVVANIAKNTIAGIFTS